MPSSVNTELTMLDHVPDGACVIEPDCRRPDRKGRRPSQSTQRRYHDCQNFSSPDVTVLLTDST